MNAAVVIDAAHQLYVRANETSSESSSESSTNERPPIYKVIGICLAVGSGAFIGTSFVLKKVGLLKANEKYNEVAGEGYGYLKNAFWWSGMILMIIGEICNFVAYAFTDAILVTPLGALSVVLTTILSAIFLKERLSMIGKVACFLCIVGSIVIVMNAPQESSVSTIQEMQHYVIAPGFLSYAGVILVGSVVTAYYAGPRWGKKNMLVYLSICSWVGALSVVATQGLGSAIVAQVSGTPQFNQWFLYVLLVFVIGTLVTEIIFLNKALNLFNAAMVTPTYYVYFTSTTIITSAVLFRGFKGSVTSIITVVNGFLTICSGVVLLQLSKSAKDVPDTAVFAGDLDQIQTIAEQEQPETEPKADAIRGTAALVRRFSSARQNMEINELKRLHAESNRGTGLGPVSENGTTVSEEYEWDGIRRRRTLHSRRSRPTTSLSSNSFTLPPRTPHPPLGWSHMPTEEELQEEERLNTPNMFASLAGTIRVGRRRNSLVPSNIDDESTINSTPATTMGISKSQQSPMHPMQLTEIAVPIQQHQGGRHDTDDEHTNMYYSGDNRYGLPPGRSTGHMGTAGYAPSDASSLAPDPPPHSARRQFSFQNVFRRHQQQSGPHQRNSSIDSTLSEHRPTTARGYATQVRGATEEERLGLVKNEVTVTEGAMGHVLPAFVEEEDGYDDDSDDDKGRLQQYTDADDKGSRYGRGITGSSPPRYRSATVSENVDNVSGNTSGLPQQARQLQKQEEQEHIQSPPRGGSNRYMAPPGGDEAFI